MQIILPYSRIQLSCPAQGLAVGGGVVGQLARVSFGSLRSALPPQLRQVNNGLPVAYLAASRIVLLLFLFLLLQAARSHRGGLHTLASQKAYNRRLHLLLPLVASISGRLLRAAAGNLIGAATDDLARPYEMIGLLSAAAAANSAFTDAELAQSDANARSGAQQTTSLLPGSVLAGHCMPPTAVTAAAVNKEQQVNGAGSNNAAPIKSSSRLIPSHLISSWLNLACLQAECLHLRQMAANEPLARSQQQLGWHSLPIAH